MERTPKAATAEELLPLPLQFLPAWIGMWLGKHQARVIEYQRAENAGLRERLGKHRLRLTDGERRGLAKLGKALGRKALRQVATIATPDIILRWYGELVAVKHDGSTKRCPGRPRKSAEIVQLLLEMANRNAGWGYTSRRDALNDLGHRPGSCRWEKDICGRPSVSTSCHHSERNHQGLDNALLQGAPAPTNEGASDPWRLPP